MTKLLEIKDKAIKFYGEYETYLFPIVKFVLAFVTFLLINKNVGFMEKINSLTIVLVLALLCCLLPVNAIVWISAIMILIHMYALSIEVAATTLLVLALVYFLYFRFAPRDGIIAILTPLCFHWKIPYVMPVACGLLREMYSVVAIAAGTVLFYFLNGIKTNASEIVEVTSNEDTEMLAKFNVPIGQVLGNKEMYLVIAILIISSLVVCGIRKIKMNYAWAVAIVSGIVIQLVGLFIGFLELGVSGKTIEIIIGNIIALIVGFILQFLFMNLDYARTERVQFEDDEYFYYVKAIPKKMVTSEEKTVKHFGNTASIGKRIDRSKANTSMDDEEVSRKVIARELEIDEDLLK